MAGKQTPAGDADRAFATTLATYDPRFGAASGWSDEYAARQANRARGDMAHGDMPSVRSGRGHIVTPEHPERALRLHGEGSHAFAHAAGRTKYRQALEALINGPITENAPAAERVERRLLAGDMAEAAPTIIHRRQLAETPAGAPLAFGVGTDTANIYIVNTEAQALAILEDTVTHDTVDANGERHYTRVTVSGFDCSRRDWQEAFVNPGHAPGIGALGLLKEFVDSGKSSFERFIMDILNRGDGSNGARWRMTHICQWQIAILPSDTSVMRQLRREARRR